MILFCVRLSFLILCFQLSHCVKHNSKLNRTGLQETHNFLSSKKYAKMGVTLQLGTKYKDLKNSRKGIFSNLSRLFTSFVDGSFEEKNSEFSQVEKLLNIDLSLFLEKAEVVPNDQDLQYQLILAEDAKDDEMIEQIKREIKEIKKEWKKNYDNTNTGWIVISALRSTVQNLIYKLQEEPYFYKKMRLNYNWEWYFYVNKTHFKSIEIDPYYINNSLIQDLKNILSYLNAVENQGCKFVTFRYC